MAEGEGHLSISVTWSESASPGTVWHILCFLVSHCFTVAPGGRWRFHHCFDNRKGRIDGHKTTAFVVSLDVGLFDDGASVGLSR